LFREDLYAIGRFFGWHPDSQQVLFWSLDIALWLAHIETGELTTLALVDGPIQGAALSPDGQEIIYVARSNSSHRTMWKVSAAGSDAQPLFDLAGSSYVFAWSPDGTYILYAGGSGTDSKSVDTDTSVPSGPLWLMDPIGQNRRPLSGPFIFGWGFEPEWSPDGRQIAFTGVDEGQRFGCAQKDPQPDPETCKFEGTGIYVENIETGEVRRLASGIEPTWSPDGSMIAFLSNQTGTPEIWIIRADGNDLRQLTTDAQSKGLRLAWSPARR
jgi:TolB protein